MRANGKTNGIKCVGALLLAVLGLTGCGATAQIDTQQAAAVAAQMNDSTMAAATAETADMSLLAQLVQELYAAPEDTAPATPETANPFVPFTAEQRVALDAFCAAQPGAFSVYVQDIATGAVYAYGSNTVYYPASLLKAAYALWLCEMADAGKISLETGLPNIFYDGLADENLQRYNGTAAVPARAALHEMIAASDNDSTTLLANKWPGTPDTGFGNFVAQLGFTAPDSCVVNVEEGILGEMTVTDAAAAMRALYDYFASDADNAEFLQECFLESDHDMLYVPQGIAAAKKYGSWDYAYHDAAIVYAPFPYIICCMTDSGTAEVDFPPQPTQAMQTLGEMIYKYLNS